jgi:hypothetical protein
MKELEHDVRESLLTLLREILEDAALTETLASVVHLAYHPGAIRQVAQAASGPPARDYPGAHLCWCS